MVICFNCPPDVRDLIEELAQTGTYRDTSDVIATAVRNLAVLEQSLSERPHLKMDSAGSTMNANAHDHAGVKSPPAFVKRESRRLGNKPATESVREEALSRTISITPPGLPPLFQLPDSPPRPELIAAEPDDVWLAGQEVPVDRWLFGQFNRLLPAKASCRALANLFLKRGLVKSLDEMAGEIARAATVLGTVLSQRDQQSSIPRDDALATAFPSSSGVNAEKGVLRFSSQFVVSVSAQGQLSGLLVGLKLINRLGGPRSPISLTNTGWAFAALRNPILDEGHDGRNGKFSADEVDFLLEHILASVPAERFAYRKLIEAIESGAKTPDALDEALAPLRSKAGVKPSFVTTQRSGAISRMSDVGLVERVRSGVRVEYAVTEKGRTFLSAAIERKG